MTNKQQPILLLPTNEDTTGPYFPTYFSDESYEDLTQIHSGVIAGPTGQHIILRGSVLDRNGKLANGVLLEFWQANAKGIYRNPSSENHPDLDPWFDGYGRLRSTTGEYTYRTILPGALKDRAPNITVTIFSDIHFFMDLWLVVFKSIAYGITSITGDFDFFTVLTVFFD